MNMNIGHSGNSREGKQKQSHNRKAGHARAIGSIGKRSSRRRGSAGPGTLAREWRSAGGG